MAKLSSVFLRLFMQDYSYSQLSSLSTAQGMYSGGILSHPAEWRRVYTCHNTGDLLALTVTEEMTLPSSWLIQQCWNLVSRMHTVLCRNGWLTLPYSDFEQVSNWYKLDSNWLCNSVSSLPSLVMCDVATDMQPPLLQCVLTLHQGLTGSVVA